MNKHHSTWVAASLLVLAQAVSAVQTAHAGDFDLKDTVSARDSKAIVDDKGNSVSEGNFGRQKFTLTFDTRFGYDDNTLGQPDTARVPTGVPGKFITQNVDQSDSAFFNFSLGIGYTAATPRLTLTFGADVGLNYFFDRPGRDYDVNGGLSLRATYKLTPRMFLDFSSYNAYESQGDYGATNLTGFTGAAVAAGSTPGTTAQRNGDYFYTTNRIGLTYQFTPRFSTTFSDNFTAFAYDDEPYSTDQDRIENVVSFEAGYLVLPNLTLAADYRFGYIDYFGVSNDSMSHFLLAGVDYSFNPRTKASIRAGAEFREYFDTVGDETSPYVETSFTYDISRDSHLSFTGRYSIEEGDLSSDNTKSNTVRLGLSFEQNITPRISAYVGLYFTDSYERTPAPIDPRDAVYSNNGKYTNFRENDYDVAAGLRYTINRHFSAEIGYTHTTVDSDLDIRSYDRNRYFGGVRFQF